MRNLSKAVSLALVSVLMLPIFFIIDSSEVTGQPPPHAQNDNGFIHGHVITESNQSVGDVEVIVETDELANPFQKIVSTNIQGHFVMQGLPEAEYVVWVRGEGISDCERETVQVSRQGPNLPLELIVEDSPAEWTLPNRDLRNQRQACSGISSFNVDELEVTWTRDITATTAYGTFASTPLISNGVVYLHDLNSNVAAVDIETGATIWTRDYDEAVIGPNGFTLNEGKLYGVTQTTVFALDPSDGSEIWRRDVLMENRQFSIAPQVHDGHVYAGTISRANGGLIFALDADNGDLLWTFNTLDDPSVIPPGTSAGGVWYTPLIDPDGNVYFGTGNAYITPRHGLENPAEILYTCSLVKLDFSTGELQWYYQAVPNDIYDWDMQVSPIYVGGSDPMVLGSGKMGYIYAFDPDDGTLLWETSVGDHNGHDNDSVMALENPGSVVIEPPIDIAPGVYGGVETPMAYEDGVVYAAIANHATTLSDLDINYGGATGTFDFVGNTGEMVALDVSTGDILWSTDLPGMAFGAATISNDLVFTTTFDGKIFALSRDDGSIVWQDDLPSGTNAPIVLAGNTLVTASSFPQEVGQNAKVVVYELD